LSSDSGSYCTGIPGIGIAGFYWTYTDIDCDKEKAFQFQVDDDSNLDDAPIINYIANNLYWGECSSDEVVVPNEQSPLVSLTPNPNALLRYGTPYYWRVKVFDARGLDSGWSPTQSFTMGWEHPAPNPYYTVVPPSPGKDVEVTFNGASSTCYDTAQYYCSENSSNTFTWWFGDPHSPDPYSPNYYPSGDASGVSTTHIYTNDGRYQSYLKVCDEVNGEIRCCYNNRLVPVGDQDGSGLPDWREISPF